MAIFHSNFGVSEYSDEFDGLLHRTVADLKRPSQIPAEVYDAPHGVMHEKNLSEWSEHEGYSAD